MPASKVQYEKVCPVCGNRFKAKTLYSVYCSHNCSNKASLHGALCNLQEGKNHDSEVH